MVGAVGGSSHFYPKDNNPISQEEFSTRFDEIISLTQDKNISLGISKINELLKFQFPFSESINDNVRDSLNQAIADLTRVPTVADGFSRDMLIQHITTQLTQLTVALATNSEINYQPITSEVIDAPLSKRVISREDMVQRMSEITVALRSYDLHTCLIKLNLLLQCEFPFSESANAGLRNSLNGVLNNLRDARSRFPAERDWIIIKTISELSLISMGLPTDIVVDNPVKPGKTITKNEFWNKFNEISTSLGREKISETISKIRKLLEFQFPFFGENNELIRNSLEVVQNKLLEANNIRDEKERMQRVVVISRELSAISLLLP